MKPIDGVKITEKCEKCAFVKSRKPFVCIMEPGNKTEFDEPCTLVDLEKCPRRWQK